MTFKASFPILIGIIGIIGCSSQNGAVDVSAGGTSSSRPANASGGATTDSAQGQGGGATTADNSRGGSNVTPPGNSGGTTARSGSGGNSSNNNGASGAGGAWSSTSSSTSSVASGGSSSSQSSAGSIARGGSSSSQSSASSVARGGSSSSSSASSVTRAGNSASGGALAAGATGAPGGASGAASNSVDAEKMAKDMGFGTNIGNTLENTTTWETGWGQPLISQAYVNGMASRGIKTVRVPVAWNTYAVNGVIDSAKMDRVKQVVGWIEAAGMYSIVNIHWDGGWIDNDTNGNANKYRLTDDVKTKFASYWTQIATAFQAVGTRLIFEALNEESKFYVNGDTNQARDYAALNTLNQLFVTTVRAQAGYNASRALLIAGFTTDIEATCVDAFTVPNDPAGKGKLFLSVHYYTPYTFCGLDTVESWGSPQTTWGTDADKATLESLFSKLGTFSTQKKIPVILGEFAVTPGEKYPRESASRVLWMQSVTKAALARSIVPVLWDTGLEISRTDGSFSKELQSVMSAIKQ